MNDYTQSYEDWKTRRLTALKGPDGWLNIIGRFWLSGGTVTIGSASDNDIVLAAGPAHVGSLTQSVSGSVTYTPSDGGPAQELKLDKIRAIFCWK
jgi:hypothetical protein